MHLLQSAPQQHKRPRPPLTVAPVVTKAKGRPLVDRRKIHGQAKNAARVRKTRLKAKQEKTDENNQEAKIRSMLFFKWP